MDRPFIPKYGTVSQVLLQLVVASCDQVYGSAEGHGYEGGSYTRALTAFSFICSIREALLG